MRRCRYRPCGKMFMPPKPSHWFCCWDHHELHYAQNDYRGYRPSSDERYDRGFWDGTRARPSATIEIPKGIWKGMLLLCHPDKYAQEPGLQTLAGEVTRWLIDHRPSEAERN
jgi:hypothetical protein